MKDDLLYGVNQWALFAFCVALFSASAEAGFRYAPSGAKMKTCAEAMKNPTDEPTQQRTEALK